jgi:hypothetical protein
MAWATLLPQRSNWFPCMWTNFLKTISRATENVATECPFIQPFQKHSQEAEFTLDVDGVIIIAEHGDYPRNDKGQKRYPRYDFFKEMVKVFESSGRSVPVFNDKHSVHRMGRMRGNG